MAFSASARAELARYIPKHKCCCLAEVAGMAESGDSGRLLMRLGNAATARKVFLLLREAGLPRPHLTVERHRRQHRYLVEISGFPGVVEPDEAGLPARRCCRRAFARGAFLAHGSVTAPDRMYHLELSASTQESAVQLVTLLTNLGVTANYTAKRQGYVVYVKDGEQIGEFLRLVEAHQALLELENVRIVKGMKNRVNRLVNAETANVDKTVAASMQQAAAIAFLADKVGIESLPYRLRTIARARLSLPYASLVELGENLEPKISKSAVNYRLRRLITMATDMGFTASDNAVDSLLKK